MNVHVKISALLGGLLALGLIYSVNCWSGESGTAPQKVLESYGDTQVIASEPIWQMFSHKSHVVKAGLTCDQCHPKLFTRKRGAAKANGDYNMASLEKGKYCGACHNGKDAFNTTGPETCKVCHGSDMKPPETIVFNLPVKSVVFGHKAHVDMGLECANCHAQAFEMRKGAAEEHPDRFTMKALYEGKYCGVCHNGSDAFASNTRCTECHIGVKGYNQRFAKAPAGEKHHEKKEH